MKTATVRDLRNDFRRVAAWIDAGESVDITKGGKLFARLTPAKPRRAGNFKMPDIMARLERTFPERPYDADDISKGLDLARGEHP